MGNNPVNSIDPDGGWSELASYALSAGIGAGISGYAAYQNGARGSDLAFAMGYGAAAGVVGYGIGSNVLKNVDFSGVGSSIGNAAGSIGRVFGNNAGSIASAAGNAGMQFMLTGGHGGNGSGGLRSSTRRDWNWPTSTEGGVIDNWKQFYNFMVDKANNNSPCVEIAAFEVQLSYRKHPIYVVQPWTGNYGGWDWNNTIGSSNNWVNFVGEFNFGISDIVQQYHLHTRGGDFSERDKILSKKYRFNVNTIGADRKIRTLTPAGNISPYFYR